MKRSGTATAHLIALAHATAVLAGCDVGTEATSASGPVRQGEERAGGDVIATVHGHGITRAQIESLARDAKISPIEALQALEEMELLALQAEQEGYGRRPEVTAAVKRSMVQALLALEVESKVASADVEHAGTAGTHSSDEPGDESGDEPTSDGPSPLVVAQNARLKQLVAELEDRFSVKRDERAIESVTRALENGSR